MLIYFVDATILVAKIIMGVLLKKHNPAKLDEDL